MNRDDQTRIDLITQLHALEQLFAQRVPIVRVVIDEHGNELQRIVTGHFYRREPIKEE